MPDSIRGLIAGVLADPGEPPDEWFHEADAILAHPSVIELLDLAAYGGRERERHGWMMSPEVGALLADWRKS